jgi:murein DD-endopeptidase MepM/ murein hydrolase activator NlpD
MPVVRYDPNEDQVEELEGGPGAGSAQAGGPTLGLFNPLDSISFTTQYGQLRKIGKGAGSEGPTGVYRRHRGCDLAGDTGDKLYSMGDGTVSGINPVVAGDNTGCGGTIKIKYEGDASGIESMYCHCSAIFVAKGEKVLAKQHVGNMGGEPGTPGAGNTTGAHLHLAINGPGSVDWKTSDLSLGHRFGKGGTYTDKSNNKLDGTEGFSSNGTIDPAPYLIKT